MEQSASHDIAPVEKLYRHTLESIFKFCTLQELHAVLAVNRDWSSAVVSMPPICAAHKVSSFASLSVVAQSRLVRHISCVDGPHVRSLAALHFLADRMPWINEYDFAWLVEHGDCEAEAAVLARLRNVTTLSIQMGLSQPPQQHATALNHLLRAAGCMTQLESLTVQINYQDQRILFAPLASLTRLRTLNILAEKRGATKPSDEQVSALRALHSLEHLTHDWTDLNGTLLMLLQAPTPPLRWRSASVASRASADVALLLSALLDLAHLDVECRCGDVGFLLSLPRVVELTLRAYDRFGDYHDVRSAEVTRIVSTMQRCPRITELCLEGFTELTSAHLATLMPCLPRLSYLTLGTLRQMASLSFLATDALADSLTFLRIFCCSKVQSSETSHLLSLRSLRILMLFGLGDSLSQSQAAQLRAVFPEVQL